MDRGRLAVYWPVRDAEIRYVIAAVLGFMLKHWKGAGLMLIIAAALAWGAMQKLELSHIRAHVITLNAQLATQAAADASANAAALAAQARLDAQALAQARAVAADLAARVTRSQADLHSAAAQTQSLESEIEHANISASTAARRCAAMVLPGGVQHAVGTALRDANRHRDGNEIPHIQPGSETTAAMSASGADGPGGG